MKKKTVPTNNLKLILSKTNIYVPLFKFSRNFRISVDLKAQHFDPTSPFLLSRLPLILLSPPTSILLSTIIPIEKEDSENLNQASRKNKN